MTYPDTAICYVVGYGETTVGEIRATEQAPNGLDADLGATVEMWCDICTRNLCRAPWENPSGDTRQAKRA